jgi:hypothetical protein
MAKDSRGWCSSARTVGVLIATLHLCGCAAMSFNPEPRTVKLPGAEPEGHALVLGQAYNERPGYWIWLIVRSVDDTKTFGAMEPRAPYNFLVPSGTRTLKVGCAFGNFLTSQQADPVVQGELRAGQVYQLHGKLYEDSNGDPFVKVWLEPLGSRAQYDAFRESNPDEPGGRPLGKRRMAGR